MPTVPTAQNRVGIARETDAKLQPGDYSGADLQAFGDGMRQLGDTGQTLAREQSARQDMGDEYAIKGAWIPMRNGHA